MGIFDWLTKKTKDTEASNNLSPLGLTSNDANHLEIRDLLKSATALAKDKQYEIAINRLLKAYELMGTCSTEWGTKEYFRVARYYHLAGRYDDALGWLQRLYDNVDAHADSREKLYKQWGWRQNNGYAEISKTQRNKKREIIQAEIDLLNTRQNKINARHLKSKEK